MNRTNNTAPILGNKMAYFALSLIVDKPKQKMIAQEDKTSCAIKLYQSQHQIIAAK